MTKKTTDLIAGAKLASQNGNLGGWFLSLLKKTESENIDLINFIIKKKNELKGPELIPLKEIKRTFGSEENMLYRESKPEFNQRVTKIYKALKAGLKPAPLLAEKGQQGFLLLDGNHTFEALKKDFKEYWVIYYSGDEISKLGQF